MEKHITPASPYAVKIAGELARASCGMNRKKGAQAKKEAEAIAIAGARKYLLVRVELPPDKAKYNIRDRSLPAVENDLLTIVASSGYYYSPDYIEGAAVISLDNLHKAEED